MLKELYQKILNAEYIHLEPETASYAYERSGDTLYIYFEWSNGKTDWKNNFDFPAKPYRSMQNKWYAHRGFLRVWKVIEPHLQAKIYDLSVNKIVIGGYSHGAAIALLCHEYCKFNRPDIAIEGYGYGAPRVVWGFVRKAVKKRFEGFTVIRNGRDIVTYAPPAIFGYRHIGNLIEIGQDADYNTIDAHRPENYTAELERGYKMKLPKKEKIKQNITLCSVDYNKDVEQYLCYKDTRYYDNNPQMTIQLNKSREYRQATRDIKAFYRVIRRLERHGWKPTENKEEAKEAENERTPTNAMRSVRE